MKYFNTIIYLVLAVFIVLSVKQCDNNRQFKAKLDVLRASRDSLRVTYQKLEIMHDSVLKIKQEKVIEYITIYKKLEGKKDETNNIADIVYTYDERQLDSTILSYKHIPRK